MRRDLVPDTIAPVVPAEAAEPGANPEPAGGADAASAGEDGEAAAALGSEAAAGGEGEAAALRGEAVRPEPTFLSSVNNILLAFVASLFPAWQQ